MSAQQLLHEASEKLGFPLCFNYAGVASVLVDQEHQIDLEQQEGTDSLLITGVIGSLPANHSTLYLAELLAANLFGVKTQGFQPALDPIRQELLFWQTFSDTDNVAEFIHRLEVLAQLLAHWKQRLLTQPSSQAPVANTVAASSLDVRFEPMLRV